MYPGVCDFCDGSGDAGVATDAQFFRVEGADFLAGGHGVAHAHDGNGGFSVSACKWNFYAVHFVGNDPDATGGFVPGSRVVFASALEFFGVHEEEAVGGSADHVPGRVFDGVAQKGAAVNESEFLGYGFRVVPGVAPNVVYGGADGGLEHFVVVDFSNGLQEFVQDRPVLSEGPVEVVQGLGIVYGDANVRGDGASGDGGTGDKLREPFFFAHHVLVRDVGHFEVPCLFGVVDDFGAVVDVLLLDGAHNPFVAKNLLKQSERFAQYIGALLHQ